MNQAKPLATSLRFALIGGLISIIISVIFFMLDQPESKINQYLGYAVLIITVVLSIQHYRDKVCGGYVSFGRATLTGLLTGVAMSIISSVYFLVYINTLDPEFMERIELQQVVAMEERGMSDDEIEQALEMSKAFMSPQVMVAFVIFGFTLLSLFVSLIAAAFVKRDRPVQLSDQTENLEPDSGS